MTRARTLRALALAATLTSACDDPAVPLFPTDYAATYTEVRGCRASADHDLLRIKVRVSPDALDAYQLRDRPFPTGAIVLKEEFDFGDEACTGPITQWTVMEQLSVGSAPGTLDWRWQKVNDQRAVVSDDDDRCISCHEACGAGPDGYLGTCAVP